MTDHAANLAAALRLARADMHSAPPEPSLVANEQRARLAAVDAALAAYDADQARPEDADGVQDSPNPLAAVRDHIARNPDAFDPI